MDVRPKRLEVDDRGQCRHRDRRSRNRLLRLCARRKTAARPGRGSTTKAIMDLVKRHPDRFVGIATVPLQDPPRAASVLEHAIRDLKMSGVTIASNVVRQIFRQQRLRSVLAKGRRAGRADDHASGVGSRQRQNGRLRSAHRLRQSRRHDPLGGLHDLQRRFRSLSKLEAGVAPWRRFFPLPSRQV